VVILARECGLPATMEGLAVEALVPLPLAGADVSAEAYLSRLPEFDGAMAAAADAAAAEGAVVRYIGRVDVPGRACSVKLARVPAGHPFAQLSGTDNMIVFTTRRYAARPLIVRGPGAGAEVTAAGVFNDLLSVLRAAGAPSL
jgi:aspartokinase/homoserine dehydrogenase 1